jgi:hypothetical protein
MLILILNIERFLSPSPTPPAVGEEIYNESRNEGEVYNETFSKG